MFQLPSFRIDGTITECREVKNKSGKLWFYSVTIMGMGASFELSTKSEKVYESVAEGQMVTATGHFEQGHQGGHRMIVDRMVDYVEVPAAKPAMKSSQAA